MIVDNHWECSLGIQPKVPQRVRFFRLVLLVTRCCDSDLAAFWLHIFSRNSGWLTIPISSWVTCMTWHGILFFVNFPCSKSLRQKRWRPNFKAKMNPISRTTRELVPIAAWKVKHILSGPFSLASFFWVWGASVIWISIIQDWLTAIQFRIISSKSLYVACGPYSLLGLSATSLLPRITHQMTAIAFLAGFILLAYQQSG